MQIHHVFESPERFVVGTVGAPGEREFYLQARADGIAVTVGVEKAEVAALSEGLTVLLSEVHRGERAATQIPRISGTEVDRGPLEGSVNGGVEADFTLDRLTVAWDGDGVVIEAAATAPASGPDDALPMESISEEEEADVAAVLAELDAELDDVEVPTELDDLDQPVALLRVRLTMQQAYAFVARADAVVAAGRPPCVLCGRPDGPEGHRCARLN